MVTQMKTNHLISTHLCPLYVEVSCCNTFEENQHFSLKKEEEEEEEKQEEKRGH